MAAGNFTNFCCRSGGSNLNAGTRTGDTTVPGTSATFTYASGNWVQSTGVFTPASGNPQSDGVATGDWVSVYADGSTTTGFVGRVTGVTTTTITVSLTFKGGTAPTDGTGNRTLKVGGAWAGPSGTSQFPLSFANHAMRNASDYQPRINFCNDQTYTMTSGITTAASQLQFQGFTSAYGDGGRAVFDGGATGTSYTLLAQSAIQTYVDLEFKNNGNSSAQPLITASAATFLRCVIRDCRLDGIRAGGMVFLDECEFYGCNQANTADISALLSNGGQVYANRCIMSYNTGSNAYGVRIQNGYITNCIIAGNGSHGIRCNGTQVTILGCDLYSNGGDGISLNGTLSHYLIENCNFIKNGAYGIRGLQSWLYGRVANCGFGAGTQANTSGTTSAISGIDEIGSVTYASNVTPWVDPANGDFRINLATAKNAGRGTFLQTQSGQAGAVGYPDIGAAQHTDSGGGGSVSANLSGGIFQ